MSSELTSRGFVWMERRFGALTQGVDPEAKPQLDEARSVSAEALLRPSQAERVRALLPTERARTRALRNRLPAPWRGVLDQVVAGVITSPAVVLTVQRLVEAHRETPSAEHSLLGRALTDSESLSELAVAAGFVALGAASTRLDRRGAARLRRATPAAHAEDFMYGTDADEALARFARDALARISVQNETVADRAEALGLLFFAAEVSTDVEPSRERAIARLLGGRVRSQFHELVTSMRRSSRRDQLPQFLGYLTEAFDGR